MKACNDQFSMFYPFFLQFSSVKIYMKHDRNWVNLKFSTGSHHLKLNQIKKCPQKVSLNFASIPSNVIIHDFTSFSLQADFAVKHTKLHKLFYLTRNVETSFCLWRKMIEWTRNMTVLSFTRYAFEEELITRIFKWFKRFYSGWLIFINLTLGYRIKCRPQNKAICL